ncbi:MAG TPA: FadR/GntR family transcriptional regulator [Roseiflexaceae bacterium]|nr:FadR/GntR family transcriptional regulator [Roseiflexaceae bacterium]
MSDARPQRLSLPQQCAERMKQHVLRNRLGPGDRLPSEHEWVEMLGVSRLVVREALQLLAGSGLIDVQQGRGAFVRAASAISVFDQITFGLDLEQLGYADVREARAMLDLTVVELCMLRAGDVELAELAVLVELIGAGEARGEQVEELHRAFHYRLLRAAGNPLIERIGTALLDTFWRIGDSLPDLVHPSGERGSYRHYAGHRALLDAVRGRDIAGLRQAVAAHLPIQPGARADYPSLLPLEGRGEAWPPHLSSGLEAEGPRTPDGGRV